MSKNKKREGFAFIVAMISIVATGVITILYCMGKIPFWGLVVGGVVIAIIYCVGTEPEEKPAEITYDNTNVSYCIENNEINYEKPIENNTKKFEYGDIVKVDKYGIYGAVIDQDDKTVTISSNDGEYVDTFDKDEVEKE